MPLHQDSPSAPYVTNLGVVGMYTRALQTLRHAIWPSVSAAGAHAWPWACSMREEQPTAGAAAREPESPSAVCTARSAVLTSPQIDYVVD